MKAKANERGVIEQGFQRAEDGWHVVVFQEGIEELTNKDGEEVFNKRGDQLWKFPLKVDDDQDDSHEVEIDIIVAENDKGEQSVVDYLGATDLFPAFEKKFPGDDVSIFDSNVIGKVKTKLPGEYLRVKTKQNTYKDRNGEEQIAVNIVAFGKMSDNLAKLESTLFPDADGSGDAGGKGGNSSKDDSDNSGKSSSNKSTESDADTSADDDGDDW